MLPMTILAINKISQVPASFLLSILLCKFRTIMLKIGVWLISFCFWVVSALAGDYTEQEAHAAWDHWKGQPVTESNFRAICDLVQDIARNHIDISYEILSEYVPVVRKTGNKAWVHILLMSW